MIRTQTIFIKANYANSFWLAQKEEVIADGQYRAAEPALGENLYLCHYDQSGQYGILLNEKGEVVTK